ncbi:hypothetical protein ES705_50986 [subsurface metagenome]
MITIHIAATFKENLGIQWNTMTFHPVHYRYEGRQDKLAVEEETE